MNSVDKKGRGEGHGWLRKMAEAEELCGSVSVGGLASDLGMLRSSFRETDFAFGRLIELARRARGWTLIKLAEDANVDVAEIFAIEKGLGIAPEPRTVFQLAEVLKLPFGKLQELSGLAEARDEILTREAVKFAARAEPTAKLTSEERDAFEEFVKVLAGRAAKGSTS